ncbi:MAG: hypothetical protein HY321_15720 [Armatimonadetes bacterium]|nr:hypothetical protein [Armatimonadota bacterium]
MILLTALGMIVFLGFVGLVLDVGRHYVVRQQMRNACDQGSMAGTQELSATPTAAEQEQARVDALDFYCRTIGATTPPGPYTRLNDGQTIQADVTVAGATDTVTVTTPWPLDGKPESKKHVRVATQRAVPNAFIRVLGIPQSDVGTKAVGVLKARTSGLEATVAASNYGGGVTQPINKTRGDGERHSIVVGMNNTRPGILSTDQNAWVEVNSQGSPKGGGVGLSHVTIYYEDTSYSNYLSPEPSDPPRESDLVKVFAGPVKPPIFLDAVPYKTAAEAQGHYYTGNWTSPEAPSGMYFVVGDITIDKKTEGTATFVATGKITITSGGSHVNLTTADSTNHLVFYAGAKLPDSPYYTNPLSYFSAGNPDLQPGRYAIKMSNNNYEFKGTFYAPFDNVWIEGNAGGNTAPDITGALIGDTITIWNESSGGSEDKDKGGSSGSGGGNGEGPIILWDPDYAPAVFLSAVLIE